MTFFKTLLTGIKTDKLQRLPYLGYSVLLILLPFIFAFLIVLAIGAGENILGGNLQEAQDQLRSWFTIPFMIVFGIFAIALVYMLLNITVKRIRDIRLPVLYTIILILLIGVSASLIFPPPSSVSGVINLIVFIALLLIPSNSFSNRNIVK